MLTSNLFVRLSVLIAALIFCAAERVEAEPPPMPATFDRATVQNLIDNVEAEHSATILRMGYFLRSDAALPQKEGYVLLKSNAEKAVAGSKRWFLLKSLQGFAGLRVQGVPFEEGLAAYDAIFSRVPDAVKADATYTLRQAVRDYIFLLQGRLRLSGIASDSRAEKLLFKAWAIYLGNLAAPKGSDPLAILWIGVIDRLSLGDRFAPLVEEALNSATIPKSYSLFKIAAAIYIPLDSERAIEILQRAKPLLPPGDAREAQWFYDTLVDALTVNERWIEAVKTQQERVQSTGHGQGKLAFLHLRQGDKRAFEDAIAVLSNTDADENEINAATESLATFARGDEAEDTAAQQATTQATTLLTKYLSPERKRDVVQELRARLTLGNLLLRQGKVAEAKSFLQVEHLKAALITPAARRYYGEVNFLLNIVSKLNTKLQEK